MTDEQIEQIIASTQSEFSAEEQKLAKDKRQNQSANIRQNINRFITVLENIERFDRDSLKEALVELIQKIEEYHSDTFDAGLKATFEEFIKEIDDFANSNNKLLEDRGAKKEEEKLQKGEEIMRHQLEELAKAKITAKINHRQS